MWNRIKAYFTTNDTARAVHFLSGGFALLLVAFLGLGFIHAHDVRQQKQQAAHLLAADLLHLRDADEDTVDLYSELIRTRIGAVLSEKDSRRFTEILRGEGWASMLSAVGDGIEAALEGGDLRAKDLRRILESALEESEEETPLSMAADSSSVSAPSISTLPRVNPIAVAEQFFGVTNLFRGAVSSDTAVTVAYCDNVYAVFHQRTGHMTAYVVECDPGAPQLSDGECVQIALDYVSKRQGMQVLAPGDAVASRGIYLVTVSCRGGNEALVGVRQDTGRICLFLRTPGK